MRARARAVTVLAGAALVVPVAARAQTTDPGDLQRIRQRLEAAGTVRDAVASPDQPTFRTSVSEDALDIRRFWGQPDAVSPRVRPSGGPWHHEFVNMVTPDEFKGYGGILTNGEKAGLATQAMLSALAFKYLPGAIGEAIRQSRERAAKREVQLALEEFYIANPGTRPTPADARLP